MNCALLTKVKAFIINHSDHKKGQKMSTRANIEPKTIQSGLTDFPAHFSQVDNAFSHEHIQYLGYLSPRAAMMIYAHVKISFKFSNMHSTG